MDKFIIRDDAIRAMLKEQQDDIKAYGCPIPEGFDGDALKNRIKQMKTYDNQKAKGNKNG